MPKKQIVLYFALAIILLLVVGVILLRIATSSPVAETTPTPLPPIQQIKEKTRNTLSTEEVNLLNKIRRSADARTGYIEYTKEYSIVYLGNESVFQIRIQSEDVDTAKQNALSFFVKQGFESKSLCRIPLIFYISPRILDSLTKQGKTFSPTIQDCN